MQGICILLKKGRKRMLSLTVHFRSSDCLMSLFEALMALFMKWSLRARDPSKRSRIYIHMSVLYSVYTRLKLRRADPPCTIHTIHVHFYGVTVTSPV